MKGIIITVLIFISAVVKGQQDSIVSDTSIVGRFIVGDTAIFKYYDTTMVLILYSDTANGYHKEGNMMFANRDICYWQYGYQVYKRNYNYVGILYYLDADKKPLPKSIVVWQTITIK